MSQIDVINTEKVNDMGRLRTKSIRGDATCTAEEWDPYWAWSPDRTIKIKGVSCTLDQPNENGTSWVWLARGSVPMDPPIGNFNEDEMIIFVMGQRTEAPGGVEAANNSMVVMFNPGDYVQVLDGEKLYVNVRGTDTKNIGIAMVIYYE